jgi:hypothetical protein
MNAAEGSFFVSSSSNEAYHSVRFRPIADIRTSGDKRHVTWFSLAIGAAIMWGVVVSIAYLRRPFGGSARNYIFVFLALWALTMGTLTLMAIAESS